MKIEIVDYNNLDQAVFIYETQWREYYREIGTIESLKKHDYEKYIVNRMPNMYLICDGCPTGIFYLNNHEIANLYIHPDYRRMGYGSACIRFAMDKYDKLRIMVSRQNSTAVTLYTRMGFVFPMDEAVITVGEWNRNAVTSE